MRSCRRCRLPRRSIRLPLLHRSRMKQLPGDVLTRRRRAAGAHRRSLRRLPWARAWAPLKRRAAKQRRTRPAMLPAGIRSRLVNDINGIRMHILEAGFETPGRPGGAPPPRLSGTGVQLAEGHAADRHGRVSRLRARRARVRAHVRCGRQVHRRPQAVWHRQQDPRHARIGVRAGLSLGRRRHRARPGFAPRRLVRARATGRLPLGGHDERSVRRPACAAVQYRERASSGGIRM